ncbi:hypothetical protein GHN92_04950 [Pseudomonas sp. FSL R10-2964]|nr:hypothetical protein [Pseudomonas sp. FSL R10-2964]
MPKIRNLSLLLTSTLALASCTSAPPVCPPIPTPPAALMQPPPNLQLMLDRIMPTSLPPTAK